MCGKWNKDQEGGCCLTAHDEMGYDTQRKKEHPGQQVLKFVSCHMIQYPNVEEDISNGNNWIQGGLHRSSHLWLPNSKPYQCDGGQRRENGQDEADAGDDRLEAAGEQEYQGQSRLQDDRSDGYAPILVC